MSAASMTFLLTSTLLKLCAATNKCGCSGVHDLDHLRTNGLRDVGERGHGVAIAQKTSIARGLVVENQRSVERTTARRRHPIFLLGLRNSLSAAKALDYRLIVLSILESIPLPNGTVSVQPSVLSLVK